MNDIDLRVVAIFIHHLLTDEVLKIVWAELGVVNLEIRLSGLSFEDGLYLVKCNLTREKFPRWVAIDELGFAVLIEFFNLDTDALKQVLGDGFHQVGISM